MVELANPKPNEKVADLGSGDGRISIEFGKKKCIVRGFELDLNLKKNCEEKIKQLNLENFVTISQEDFWTVDFCDFDIIAIYPMPDIIDALEKKLHKECKSGTRILLNYYSFTNWKETKQKDHVFLYTI